MKHEFKKIAKGTETRYVLDEFATGGSSSAASVASLPSALGGVRRRADSILAQETDTVKVPVKQKPRQGALRTQTGAGAHRDKKKEQKQGKEKHRKPYMEELKDRIATLKSKLEETDLAQRMLAISQQAVPSARLAGSPEQERERSQQIIAQRAAQKAKQERQAAQADAANLPALKSEYEKMLAQYKSLGGSNWQYADREQNLSSAERKARDMEPALRQLAARISRAEQQGVAEGNGISKDKETAFHAKLDKLVHNTFGKRDDEVEEAAPKGWEGTVKAMKKHKDIDNPWALAHWMKNKGYKSHKKEEGVAEGNMPSSVIKHKQKIASMSDKEFADSHKEKSDDDLKAMAWRHGHGKDSSHYVDKRKRGQGVAEDTYTQSLFSKLEERTKK